MLIQSCMARELLLSLRDTDPGAWLTVLPVPASRPPFPNPSAPHVVSKTAKLRFAERQKRHDDIRLLGAFETRFGSECVLFYSSYPSSSQQRAHTFVSYSFYTIILNVTEI